MEPSEVLSAAFAAVTEAGIPEPLHPVALAKAVDLIAGRVDVPTPAEPGQAQPPRRSEEGGGAMDGKALAIGKELEIDPALVERLFDEHDGQLQFVGDLEKLGGSKQAKVEKLAVILCAARQAGGTYDEDGRTPDSAIRHEVERHGLYDVTNFSKHLKPLTRRANVNGTGKSATYKMKYEGRVEAREVAQTLLAD